ncbi:MAG: aminomethyltransferase family protein [Candidatus Xenobia bacterium]
MGVPTPFHNKTAPLMKSMRWKEWAGYYAPEKYDPVHDNEYHLFRQSAGLLDVSPLFKYDVRGRDAMRLMNRIMTRDVRKLKQNQVGYTCWCDDDGKVIDDGTIWRLEDDWLRVTSANPSMRWFLQNAEGMKVDVVDSSERIAALALQGPKALDVLNACADKRLDTLKFFWLTSVKLGDVDTYVTRTGYTGDLGYEIWVPRENAERLWDVLMDAGRIHGIGPAGLNALDMCRIEAGFILIDVDYTSAKHAMIEDQKSSPFEISLGWTVHLDKDVPFIGQQALIAEKQRGSDWGFVGLEIDWVELEQAYDAAGLPPHLPTAAWRQIVPVYDRGRQIGRATSGVWSPILKKNLALATVEAKYEKVGTELKIEQLVDWQRKLFTARVVNKPFFDPPRKKAVAKSKTTANGTTDKMLQKV